MAATAGSLRQTIADLPDETPMLWQFYTVESAFIPEAHFEAVARVLQDNEPFLEDLHNLISDWFDRANDNLIKQLGEDNNRNAQITERRG